MNVLVIALDAGSPLDLDDGEVLVVAPAVNSRLRHWLSDDDGARRTAAERLAACLDRLERSGVHASGCVGDADPLQAIADALPTFAADEIVIAADPDRSRGLAGKLVERMRARFALPIVAPDAAARRIAASVIEAVVMGRVGIDLYPNELRTPLREVRTYTRFVGGFAGNVSTGLARLGVATAIVSRVGDDPHGAFVRDFLAGEGVDVRFLAVDPDWLTPPTFCEVWPPDRFPIFFHRRPTVPDWQLAPGDFDAEEVAAAPLLFATGTALAQSPSRETTLEAMRTHRGTTVFDCDWRPTLWDDPAAYAPAAAEAAALADVVVGNEEEVEAARLADARPLVLKRGGEGVTVFEADAPVDVAATPVDVVNGLGAGDAFAAALGYALVRGLDLVEGVRLGSVAGAIVAGRLACSEAMPTLDELKGRAAEATRGS